MGEKIFLRQVACYHNKASEKHGFASLNALNVWSLEESAVTIINLNHITKKADNKLMLSA